MEQLAKAQLEDYVRKLRAKAMVDNVRQRTFIEMHEKTKDMIIGDDPELRKISAIQELLDNPDKIIEGGKIAAEDKI